MLRRCGGSGKRTIRRKVNRLLSKLSSLVSVSDKKIQKIKNKQKRKYYNSAIVEVGSARGKMHQLFGKMRAQFTESGTFEKGHESLVATNKAKGDNRAFVPCALIPTDNRPSNQFL